ncbi:MAG: hypothetical protein U1E74_01200 [Paenacidovorax caeni]
MVATTGRPRGMKRVCSQVLGCATQAHAGGWSLTLSRAHIGAQRQPGDLGTHPALAQIGHQPLGEDISACAWCAQWEPDGGLQCSRAYLNFSLWVFARLQYVLAVFSPSLAMQNCAAKVLVRVRYAPGSSARICNAAWVRAG